MTAAAAAPSPPGPRIAAGLWPRFAPLSPAAVVAGVVPILRVEVLVEAAGRRPLDPLARAVLTALPLADPPTAAGVDRLLSVGEERAEAALAEAGRMGWVEPSPGMRFGVRVSAAGRDALEHGHPADPLARRRFAFRGDHFLPLPDPGPLSFDGAPGSPSSRGPLRGLPLVQTAFGRPDGWKRDAGFPLGGEVIAPTAGAPGNVRWQAVPLESEGPLGLVAVAVSNGGSVRAFGFVPAADWSLPAEPSFALAGEAARAAFPEVFADPSDADLRAAWLGWAKFRGVPPDDLAACAVALDRHRLVVRAPDRLVGWLRAHRADVLACDTWVWVGTGQLRRPAVIDVRGG